MVLYLALAGLTWVGVYASLRSPRRPFSQFRESPVFNPRSRMTAMVSATIVAGALLTYLLLNAPAP